MSVLHHMVRLPTPSDAPEASLPVVPQIEESPLPLWYKDVAVLDEAWATEAASVLDLLSKSDYNMVQSNAIGSEGAVSALAYSGLLMEMQHLQEETVKENNRKPGNWISNSWDGFVGMFTKNDPLAQRMEELLRNRKTLVENARNRLNGLQHALDQRSEVDERAMVLLDKLPQLEEKATSALEKATLALAETPESEAFEVFRRRQLEHRSSERAPNALFIVREQLQNAVMLGAPLRDTIDTFIEMEQDNQNKFEISFNVHVGNLAVLQGLQQSQRNAAASQLVIDALPLPKFEALPPPKTVYPNTLALLNDKIEDSIKFKNYTSEQDILDMSNRLYLDGSNSAKNLLNQANKIKAESGASDIIESYLLSQKTVSDTLVDPADPSKNVILEVQNQLSKQAFLALAQRPYSEVKTVFASIETLPQNDLLRARLKDFIPSGDLIEDVLPGYIAFQKVASRDQDNVAYQAGLHWFGEYMLETLVAMPAGGAAEMSKVIRDAIGPDYPLAARLVSNDFSNRVASARLGKEAAMEGVENKFSRNKQRPLR